MCDLKKIIKQMEILLTSLLVHRFDAFFFYIHIPSCVS